jgi:hypothetical protein
MAMNCENDDPAIWRRTSSACKAMNMTILYDLLTRGINDQISQAITMLISVNGNID